MTSINNKSSKKTISNKSIAIFSANYLPNIGGIEQFTYHLSQELEKCNTHVIIVTNNVFDLKQHEFLDNGVEIFRLPCIPLINGRLPLPRKNQQYKLLINKLKDISLNYVLINTRFYPHTFLGVKVAKYHKIVPVLIDHGSAYITLGNKWVDCLIVIYEKFITAMLKHKQIDFYGISQSSVKWLSNFNISAHGVINNSIDADQYLDSASDRDFISELRLPKDTFLVTFTGRLIPEKGIYNLIEAATILKSLKPNVSFAIAGDGVLKAHVEKKNPGNIYLLGKLSSSDVASLLKQSNAFCLPSRSEGFSTSLLEAAACNIPPIITNVGGVEELIPSKDYGIILNDNPSGEEIANAIVSLANNYTKSELIGNNIGKRVREYFSWKETADKTISACLKANSSKQQKGN